MNPLGQYFTKNNDLKEKLFSFILNDPVKILEPSIGRGDLVSFVSERLDVVFDMYEIDQNIKLLEGINKSDVIYCDFLQETIHSKYATIIGNPPYIKTKKGNAYLRFIDKCYQLLEDTGELIFIVPSDFFKLTSSEKVIEKMLSTGTFTHIYHPHNENLFEGASIDVLIFRYCKTDILSNKVFYNETEMYLHNNNGIITFSENKENTENIFKDFFDIYVGIVSGKEEVYKNEELGNVEVLTGENQRGKYILIESFPSENDYINDYLLFHKTELIRRQIRKFNENNWFEWGALRNINKIQSHWGKNCIYIHNLTRKTEIAFTGTVEYFNGNLIMLLPKIDIDIEKIVEYLNSDIFKNNYIFSGRFKIGHKQIANASIVL